MSDNEVVETLYGEYSKYEIIKDESLFGSPKFYLHKNGSPYRGSFSSLSSAVEAAREEGAE